MIDWTKVLEDSLKAAENVIGARWPSVAQTATIQITALVENAKFIEQQSTTMTDMEYKASKINQQRALEGVLSGFAAISIVVAEQVAAAVWGVIEAALKTIPSLAAFI
ncbi:MAG: hypothetical protein JOY71_08990 [Acetobacteraceae bacterium]|nr:hypothetical protein [Acetobacteraceae bacterium]